MYQRVVFVRVGWMDYYGFFSDQDEKPIGGGSHNIKNIGAEHSNFKVQPDKRIRGYILLRNKYHGLNLNRIETNIEEGAEYLEDVLIVMFATRPKQRGSVIVGWYKNARAFRSIQKMEQSVPWVFDAAVENCVLLPAELRSFEIPRGSEAPGTSNVFYVMDSNGKRKDAPWIDEALQRMDSYNGPNVLKMSHINELLTLNNKAKTIWEGNDEGEQIVVELKQRKRDSSPIRERKKMDNYRCQHCGYPDKLRSHVPDGASLVDVHHIFPLQDGERKTKIEDLISLCPNCHRLIHVLGRAFRAPVLDISFLQNALL